ERKIVTAKRNITTAKRNIVTAKRNIATAKRTIATEEKKPNAQHRFVSSGKVSNNPKRRCLI
ncbi:MAG: hypothetical protein ACKO8L_06840, partial [Flavobacterium sp.]